MEAGGEAKSGSNNESKRGTEKDIGPGNMRNMSIHRPEMKAPKNHDSLSWGRRKGQKMRSEDAVVVSNALSSLNSFSDYGNFMSEFMNQHKNSEGKTQDASTSKSDNIREADSDSVIKRSDEEKQPLSANQLAAKAMQLRLKGKHEEAEKLLVQHLKFEFGVCPFAGIPSRTLSLLIFKHGIAICSPSTANYYAGTATESSYGCSCSIS